MEERRAAVAPAVSGSYREGKQGERIRVMHRLQIEKKERLGRHVRHELRRAEVGYGLGCPGEPL